MKISKKNKQNNILYKPFVLFLELHHAIRVFICLQIILILGALLTLPNCLDGLKAAAVFKFHSFLLKTSLYTSVTVSICF